MALLSGLRGARSAPSAEGEIVKDSDTQHFVQDVIQASRDQPVIVDFWAPWCGPCKQLGPALEKGSRRAGGKVRLVKVNIDENPEIAQQLRVQSIPAVFAFNQGQPVDGFVGALPESQIKAFVERLRRPDRPGAGEEALEQAKAARRGRAARARRQVYQQVLEHEPGNRRGARRPGPLPDRPRPARRRPPGCSSACPRSTPITRDRRRARRAGAGRGGRHGADPAALQRAPARRRDDHQARSIWPWRCSLRGQSEAAIDQLLE